MIVQTNCGPMSATDVVDFLTFRSYQFNRDRSPHITAEQWALVFGPDTPALEAAYLATRVQKVETIQ